MLLHTRAATKAPRTPIMGTTTSAPTAFDDALVDRAPPLEELDRLEREDVAEVEPELLAAELAADSSAEVAELMALPADCAAAAIDVTNEAADAVAVASTPPRALSSE